MGYARQVLLTVGVRMLLIPLGLLYAVVTARWLGPEHFGVLVSIATLLGVVGQLGNLGYGVAITRFVASRDDLAPGLFANGRWIGAATGIAAIGLVALTSRLVPEAFGAVPRTLLLVAALTLPFTLAAAHFQALVLGRQRIATYNAMEVLDRVAQLALALVVLVALGLGLRALVVGLVVVAGLQSVVYHVVLWPDSRRLAPDPGALRRMIGFSGRAYLTCLLSFLVLRSDILLLNALAGAEQTGLYGIAVRAADFLLLLPAVAGALLFPRIARDESRESAAFTAAVVRHMALLMTAALAGLAVTAPLIVTVLFGADYGPAVVSIWVLLPGAWCMALQGVLSNDLAGRDYPLFLPVAWSAMLAINVLLNFWWIPRFGHVGAALSSAVVYLGAFVLMTGYWRRRFPEVLRRDLFVLRRGEWRALLGHLRAAVDPRRSTRRTPPA